MTERWCYSSDEEHFNGGECATRDDAVREAVDEEIVEPGRRFWVGRCAPPEVEAAFEVDDVIEHLTQRVADDEVADGYGDDWPSFPAKDSRGRAELEEIVEKFNDAVDEWVAKNDPPTWWKVVDVEEWRMPEREGDEPERVEPLSRQP